MKTRPLVLRIAAVVSSLTLFMLFVYDRAGGGSGGFLPQQEQTAAPNPPRTVNLNAIPRPNEATPRSQLLAGSKSKTLGLSVDQGKLVLEPPPQLPSVDESARQATRGQDESAQTSRPRSTLFAGSKSSLVISPAEQAAEEAANRPAAPVVPNESAPPSQPRSTLLPGSKTWIPTTTISPSASGSLPLNEPPRGNASTTVPQPRTQLFGSSKGGVLIRPGEAVPAAQGGASAAPSETQTSLRVTLPAGTANISLNQDAGLVGTLPRQDATAEKPERAKAKPPQPKLTSQEDGPPKRNLPLPSERRKVLLSPSKAPAGVILWDGKRPLVNTK